jgi:4-hydroxybenzoyl-CoA thioesterase
MLVPGRELRYKAGMENGPDIEHRITVRVYVEDTDAGGIVYYANYLRFMERARTELLRAVGLEQSNTFQNDVSFVVYEVNMQFMIPAQLDDQLEVTARLTRVRAASLKFEQVVRRLDSEKPCCRAEVSVACVSLSRRRPRRLPEEIARLLKPVS